MPSNNPYETSSLGQLKAIERDLVAITRDPKTPGPKRRIASGDLKIVRRMLKERKNEDKT